MVLMYTELVIIISTLFVVENQQVKIIPAQKSRQNLYFSCIF